MLNLMAESCKRKYLRLLDNLGVMTSKVQMDGSVIVKQCSSTICLCGICRFMSELGPAENIPCSGDDSDEVTKDEYEDDLVKLPQQLK